MIPLTCGFGKIFMLDSFVASNQYLLRSLEQLFTKWQPTIEQNTK